MINALLITLKYQQVEDAKIMTKRRVGWGAHLCSHCHGQGAAEYSKHTPHLFPLYYSNITPPVVYGCIYC